MLKNNRYNDLLISKDLEYSQENTKHIDERVWKVCEEAGNNYDKIQKALRQKDQMRQFDIVLEDKKKAVMCTNRDLKLSLIKAQTDEVDRVPVINKYYHNESSSFITLDDTLVDNNVGVRQLYKPKPEILVANANKERLLVSNGNNMLLKSNDILYTKKKSEVVKSTNDLFKSKEVDVKQSVGFSQKSMKLNHKHGVGKTCIACELKKK
jgi:hypothetical protein